MIKRIFNSVNMRFRVGELVFWHSGEVKLFPVNKNQEAYGKISRVISPVSVEVQLFQKE